MRLAWDLVRVLGPSGRDVAEAVARQLRQVGVAAVFLPSAQVIGRWEVEVPAGDLAAARAVALGQRGAPAR